MIGLGETDITDQEIVNELQSRNITKETSSGGISEDSILQNKWFWIGIIAIGLTFFTNE